MAPRYSKVVFICVLNVVYVYPVGFATHSVRSASQTTVDPDEVRRFQSLASKWWDEQGEFAALHAMNDLRVPFIRCVYTSTFII